MGTKKAVAEAPKKDRFTPENVREYVTRSMIAVLLSFDAEARDKIAAAAVLINLYGLGR